MTAWMNKALSRCELARLNRPFTTFCSVSKDCSADTGARRAVSAAPTSPASLLSILIVALVASDAFVYHALRSAFCQIHGRQLGETGMQGDLAKQRLFRREALR